MATEAAFEAVANELLARPGIARAKMFGAPTLKAGGKVFACLFKGRLVLKLPRERVGALVAAGRAEPFDPGMGRAMKEWVAMDVESEAEMRDLAREALNFVGGG